MPHEHHTTLPGTATTCADVGRWVHHLACLHARLAPRFARPEPYRRALLYLQGIVSETERKNGWHLAEHAREARPDGMQRLLAQAVWDTEGVREDLRAYVLEQLGTEAAMVVIDETSFRHSGQPLGRGGPAVLRHQRARRELSGGGLSLLCDGPRPHPPGSRTLSASRLV